MGSCSSASRRAIAPEGTSRASSPRNGVVSEEEDVGDLSEGFDMVASQDRLTPVPSQTSGISTVPSFFNPESKPIIFEYQFLHHIGHGAQSDVFLVQNLETGIFYAGKVYDRNYLFRVQIGDSEQPIQKLAREVQIMSTLAHPNCLKMIELLEDEYTNSYVLILPYADDGPMSSLSYKADPVSEETAKWYFYQIALGLQHAHSQNIIHRDLKPDNILKFKDGHVVIADFSVSIMMEDPTKLLDDTDGTPAFYSPEECRGDPYLGKPTDVWAFGMMLYVMVFGKLPYIDDDEVGVYYSHFFKISSKIISDDFTFPENIPITDSLRDLFSHVLDKDPTTRYNIDQVVAHHWFESVVPKYENYINSALSYEEAQIQYNQQETDQLFAIQGQIQQLQANNQPNVQ